MALLPRLSHLELNIDFLYKPYAFCPITIFVCVWFDRFDAIGKNLSKAEPLWYLCYPPPFFFLVCNLQRTLRVGNVF